MGMATYSNICLHKLSHAYMVYLYLSKYLFKYDFARKILMTQKYLLCNFYIERQSAVHNRKIRYSTSKSYNVCSHVCAFQ